MRAVSNQYHGDGAAEAEAAYHAAMEAEAAAAAEAEAMAEHEWQEQEAARMAAEVLPPEQTGSTDLF